ncbi:MAG: YceI family protein [Gemmatimonadales bacterium]
MKATIKSILTTVTLSAVIATTAAAQMELPRHLTLGSNSKVWIDGTSTVKPFRCAATKIDVAVVSEPDAKPADLVRSATLVIPVASLDCRNGTMNDHMRKALKAKDNPQIKWKMTSYRVEGTNVVINGLLTIAGKENVMELRGIGTAVNGTIQLKGSKQFKMSEYGVKPPSLMLGTMKVRDPVTVQFDLVLTPE